jgi:FdhD protein
MPSQVPVIKWKGCDQVQEVDVVAVEEALEIHVNAETLTLTMRTYGDDFALAAGLLYGEGLIKSASDIVSIRHATDESGVKLPNRVLVTLNNGGAPLPQSGWERRFPSTSSCGVCGKTDLESMRCISVPLSGMTPSVSVETIYRLNSRMRGAQADFTATGGIHAAALFDTAGSVLVVREDIGRHNAVDKVIGTELLAGRTPLRNCILMISGRASFEIMQKAAVAQIPIVCAVSAPSSLAVSLAHDMNMTLIGFLRDKTMNVYSCASRITSDPAPDY